VRFASFDLGECVFRMTNRGLTYLVYDCKREQQATRILAEDLRWLADPLFHSMGISTRFMWIFLRLKHSRVHAARAGDVDLLAGPLEWYEPKEFRSRCEIERGARPGAHPDQVELLVALTLANEGGLVWPPSMRHLVAIEAKCAYLSIYENELSESKLKSTKTSPAKLRKARRQLDELLEMGFDRVALLDILASPPVSGEGIHAWHGAAHISSYSRTLMSPYLNNRFSSRSPLGHWLWSVGAVLGKPERCAGTAQLLELRTASHNPFLETPQGKANRAALDSALREELRAQPAPRNLQVVFDDCPDCGRIHPSPFC
jgi:hypothetical protein